MKRRLLFCFFLTLLMFVATSFCHASEGGAAKPITGLQVLQYGAIIPPHPGWVFAINPAFYFGSLGGERQLPIAGLLAANVDVNISFVMFSGNYIWPTSSKRWNFASAVVFPLANVDTTANVILGNRLGQRSESQFSQFDMAFVPVAVSYHISQLEHIGFNVTVWAPTGNYEVGSLANTGMNVWSFIPTFTYTRIFPTSNVSFDLNYGIDFDTKNSDTDYKNGALSYLDLLVMKKFKNGWAVGPVFSWVQQYADDEGGLADRLDGFKGRALGIGPNVGYSTKIGKETDFSFTARFLREFATKNRAEGWPILISGTFIFLSVRYWRILQWRSGDGIYLSLLELLQSVYRLQVLLAALQLQLVIRQISPIKHELFQKDFSGA